MVLLTLHTCESSEFKEVGYKRIIIIPSQPSEKKIDFLWTYAFAQHNLLRYEKSQIYKCEVWWYKQSWKSSVGHFRHLPLFKGDLKLLPTLYYLPVGVFFRHCAWQWGRESWDYSRESKKITYVFRIKETKCVLLEKRLAKSCKSVSPKWKILRCKKDLSKRCTSCQEAVQTKEWSSTAVY